jgi:hypothetical protein
MSCEEKHRRCQIISGQQISRFSHLVVPATLKLILLSFLMLTACMPIQKASFRIEEEHNALYKQKALIVYSVRFNKVWLENPTGTRCYYLKGRQYSKKWGDGDTMIIDDHLTDFYNLKFSRNCDRKDISNPH